MSSTYQRIFTGFRRIGKGHYLLDGIVYIYKNNVRFLDANCIDTDNTGMMLVYNPRKYLRDANMDVAEMVENLKAYTVSFHNNDDFTGFVSPDLLPDTLFKVNYVHGDMLDEHAYITLEVERLKNGELRIALLRFDWIQEGYLQSNEHFNEFFTKIRYSIKEEVIRLESLLRILIDNGVADTVIGRKASKYVREEGEDIGKVDYRRRMLEGENQYRNNVEGMVDIGDDDDSDWDEEIDSSTVYHHEDSQEVLPDLNEMLEQSLAEDSFGRGIDDVDGYGTRRRKA